MCYLNLLHALLGQIGVQLSLQLFSVICQSLHGFFYKLIIVKRLMFSGCLCLIQRQCSRFFNYLWIYLQTFLLYLQAYVKSVILANVLVFLFLLVAHLLFVCVDRYFWCLRFIIFLKDYYVFYCIGWMGLVNEVFPLCLGCCCGRFCRF